MQGHPYGAGLAGRHHLFNLPGISVGSVDKVSLLEGLLDIVLIPLGTGAGDHFADESGQEQIGRAHV